MDDPIAMLQSVLDPEMPLSERAAIEAAISEIERLRSLVVNVASPGDLVIIKVPAGCTTKQIADMVEQTNHLYKDFRFMFIDGAEIEVRGE